MERYFGDFLAVVFGIAIFAFLVNNPNAIPGIKGLASTGIDTISGAAKVGS